MQETLPTKWKFLKLGEVVQNEKFAIVDGPFGTQLHAKDYTDTGVPVVRITNITPDNKFNDQNLVFISEQKFNSLKRSAVVPGDILLAKTGATIGKIALFENYAEGLIASSCAKISINPDIANNKWVLYYLSTQRGQTQIIGGSSGSTRNSINLKEIANIRILLPPLPTQHKIVEILEEADNLRKLRQQADEKMKDLIPSLFIKMFGDPVKNPKRWRNVELSKCSSFKRGPFGGSLKKEIFVKNGYKVYEQKNAIYDNFDIGTYFIDKKKYSEMISFTIQPDDLIISCSGTMGRVAIVPKNIKVGIINQALLKITPNKKILTSLFLKFIIESEWIQNKYFRNTAGSAIQNVTSVAALKKIKIPLPPLPLQQEFANLVVEIEAEKTRQAESRKKLDELFSGLMQRAFTGELVA